MTSPSVPLMIDCGVCRLRPWRDGDQDSLVRHANSREVAMNLRDRFPSPYTPRDADTWVRLAGDADPVTNFAIEVDDEAVGGIGLELREDVERVGAEIGYWLGPSLWGRGIVTAAIRAATQDAFERFDLTRVYALPFARNAASIHVLEKVGYRREGVLRRSAIKEGVILDQVLLAVTDLDWPGALPA